MSARHSAGPPALPDRSVPCAPRRRRVAPPVPRPALALAGLLTLTLPVGLAPAPSAPAVAAEPPIAVEVLVQDFRVEDELVRLDPVTLAALEPPAVVTWPMEESGWPTVMSADGSTLVTVIGDEARWTVRARKPTTGTTIARYDTPHGGYPIALSRDGSRLVLGDGRGNVHLLETAGGRLVATTRSAALDPWGGILAIDAAAERLYLVEPERSFNEDPPASREELARQTPTLIAYDLTTGTERGRLALPGLVAGRWWPGGQEPAGIVWPALAVSPDGRRLAVVAADEDALRLIDTARLVVEADVAISPNPSLSDLWHRLVGLAIPLPEDAAAKMMPDGPTRQAVFAPDGQTLYVFGNVTETEVADDGVSWLVRGMRLRAVDVETGRVRAAGPTEALLDRVVPAPDGRSLFVIGPTDEVFDAMVSPLLATATIRRLNAQTLAVEAERTIDDGGLLFVRPLKPPASS